MKTPQRVAGRFMRTSESHHSANSTHTRLSPTHKTLPRYSRLRVPPNIAAQTRSECGSVTCGSRLSLSHQPNAPVSRPTLFLHFALVPPQPPSGLGHACLNTPRDRRVNTHMCATARGREGGREGGRQAWRDGGSWLPPLEYKRQAGARAVASLNQPAS